MFDESTVDGVIVSDGREGMVRGDAERADRNRGGRVIRRSSGDKNSRYS